MKHSGQKLPWPRGGGGGRQTNLGSSGLFVDLLSQSNALDHSASVALMVHPLKWQFNSTFRKTNSCWTKFLVRKITHCSTSCQFFAKCDPFITEQILVKTKTNKDNFSLKPKQDMSCGQRASNQTYSISEVVVVPPVSHWKWFKGRQIRFCETLITKFK